MLLCSTEVAQLVELPANSDKIFVDVSCELAFDDNLAHLLDLVLEEVEAECRRQPKFRSRFVLQRDLILLIIVLVQLFLNVIL